MMRLLHRFCAALLFGGGLILAGGGAATALMSIVTMQTPAVKLTLEAARTDAERQRGLMGRKALAAHRGMLFVFGADQPLHFWMKDTLIPLDMVFLDAQGRVTSVATNVPASTANEPEDAVALRDGRGSFVLELPAGEAKADAIVTGLRLKVPRFP